MNSFFVDKQFHWSGLKAQDFPCDIAGFVAVMLMKWTFPLISKELICNELL